MKLLFFMLFVNVAFAQEKQTIKSPMSKGAFDQNIMSEINFMVLGENNTKQGFSYELKEKDTELALSANIATSKKFIFTADGKFAVDNGIYIFDEKDGSKKSKFTFNFFVPLGWFNGKKYPTTSDQANSDPARTILISNLQSRALSRKIIDDFIDLHSIIEVFGLPASTIEFASSINENHLLIDGIEMYYPKGYPFKDRQTKVQEKLKSYFTIESKYATADVVSIPKLLKNDQDNNLKELREIIITQNKSADLIYIVPASLNLQKLLQDYDAAVNKIRNWTKDNNTMEIKNLEQLWTAHHTSYLGFSPYYQREQIDIYNGNPAPSTFGDLFTDRRGDLYGLGLSFNTIHSYKNGKFFLIRALANLGRGSNITDFTKKEYSINTTDTINGLPVTLSDKKTGYIHNAAGKYDTSFSRSGNFEVYGSTKYVGAYAKIGYEKNAALIVDELYPLETGLMINLNSDKKNILSLLLFVNRKNLKVHPSDDMNFGFKIGLPVFINKYKLAESAPTDKKS